MYFFAANLKRSTLHSVFFNSINFDQSDWSDVQASSIRIQNSTFNGTIMVNCSLVQSFMIASEFENATLYNVSFTDVDMRNANLSSVQCNYCEFKNVSFQGVVFKNASLRYSIFVGSLIDNNQMADVIDFTGSRLPNGTVIETISNLL